MTGDHHINSTVGLVKPVTNLDDGGTYRSSKGQRWLWRNWIDFWDSVKQEADRCGKGTKIWTVFNGDMIDKPNGKFNGTQFVSLNESDIFNMTLDTIRPALDQSDRVFIIRGTKVHVGNLEEQIAVDISAEKIGDNYSAHELLIDVENVRFDIRHHGPLGKLEWTRGNSLNKRAVEYILKYANKRVPDVAIQSHNHMFATSSEEYPIKVYALPAWQLIPEYAHRMKIITPADIGGAIFVCSSGKYEAIIKRYIPDQPRPWRLK